MTCFGPEWIYDLFFWAEYNIINQLQLDEALNWLVDKGIIVCNEVI